ncbi:LysR family transcriptional regulator [Nocardioides sp. HDW12B]|uniref:LysR family transcriptional regulator n=1 Tax=Nocardioides sp. HDW12B TaxID=2714939 RepID=UPI001409E955|nr:LysR substrate-binding domain-containing protein [Nocardioides sp. HDW12B]QIK67977.1 LysR family transcriptional regulator [Nocardioides sp. HDW12B]
MDVRRLELLLELSRLGSMREVADELGLTTSTVSQQLAALASEVGVPLLEPVGRRVRLTAAGRRLADHAVTVLAAVEAARRDLDPEAEPVGTVRVASFGTGVRRALQPLVAELAATYPQVRLHLAEHEPLESFDLLAADDVDLALVYDYTLAPAAWPARLAVSPLWTVPYGLAVPAADAPAQEVRRTSTEVLADFAQRPWITNSRNTADEEAVRTLASMAGFTPRIEHRIDSLELVAGLIGDGLGVGLLPLPAPGAEPAGVRVLTLSDPPLTQRAYAVVRAGREAWPPLRLVLERLAAQRS